LAEESPIIFLTNVNYDADNGVLWDNSKKRTILSFNKINLAIGSEPGCCYCQSIVPSQNNHWMDKWEQIVKYTGKKSCPAQKKRNSFNQII
jgi:hypothetical protein